MRQNHKITWGTQNIYSKWTLHFDTNVIIDDDEDFFLSTFTFGQSKKYIFKWNWSFELIFKLLRNTEVVRNIARWWKRRVDVRSSSHQWTCTKGRKRLQTCKRRRRCWATKASWDAPKIGKGSWLIAWAKLIVWVGCTEHFSANIQCLKLLTWNFICNYDLLFSLLLSANMLQIWRLSRPTKSPTKPWWNLRAFSSNRSNSSLQTRERRFSRETLENTSSLGQAIKVSEGSWTWWKLFQKW